MLQIIVANLKQVSKRYILGLMLATGKKVCTRMATELGNVGHDSVYQYLRHSDGKEVVAGIIAMIKMLTKECGPGVISGDNTVLSKRHAREIEGLAEDYDASEGSPKICLSTVALVWSNGLLTIPFKFDFWCNKEIMGEHYRPKTEIMRDLIVQCLAEGIMFEKFLADGLYATKDFLRKLDEMGVPFVMRMACNRVIKTDNGTAQLSKHPDLKLYRNARSRTVRGYWHSQPFYFTCEKRGGLSKGRTRVFLVSNIDAPAKEHISAYKQRWGIEVAFRCMKQHLGLADCQARTTGKQRAHIIAVFAAYVDAQLLAKRARCQTPDQYLYRFRIAKHNRERFKMHPTLLNFYAHA